MTSIVISGHRPDSFLVSHYELSMIERIIDDTLWRLNKEYGNDLYINLGGALGTDLWVGSACIEKNIKFRIYLPFSFELHTKYWKDEQKDVLSIQLQKANKITIVSPNDYARHLYFVRNKKMVDEARFLVSFWVGKRKGGTFNTMNYALNNSKFVFNALNELKPVFKEDLKLGWTPPTVNQ